MELVIFILGIIVLAIAISVLQEENEKQQKQIDTLHLECEGYLQILVNENIIPATIATNKIKQMNNKYNEIKLKIK